MQQRLSMWQHLAKLKPNKEDEKGDISFDPAQGSPLLRRKLSLSTKFAKPLESVALDVEANPHLANIIFTEVYPRGSAEVDILIGADYYCSFVNGKCINGSKPDTLTAVNSTLGWIVSGPLTGRSTSNTTTMFTCVRPDPVENILKNVWEIDSIGIVDEGTKLSLEENDAVCQFKRGLKFDGQRYEVSLPWRESHPERCDNYNQAVK